MALPTHQPAFNADDYLAREGTQVDRHQDLDGEMEAI